MASGNSSLRDQSNNFCFARSLERTQQIFSVPSSFSLCSRCFRYFRPEMRSTFHAATCDGVEPLNHCRQSPDQPRATARRYLSSSRNRAKQVPEGAIKNPPRRVIDVDRFIDIAVEKSNAENLAGRKVADVRHGKPSHEAVAGSISSTAGK